MILLLSIYFVSTVSRLFWEMRMEMAAPPEIVQQCENLLEQRDFKGIYALVKEDDSFFSRVLTTGIAELPNGLAEARDSMERVGDAITARDGKENQHVGRAGHAGSDDRAAGHAQGDDHQFRRAAAIMASGQGSGP